MALTGVFLLAGAGCVVATPPSEPEGSEASDSPAAEERESGATGREGRGAESALPSGEPGNEEMVADIEEGDAWRASQVMYQYFGYEPTHPRNYAAYQTFEKQSDRLNRAALKASPAGEEFYDLGAWVPKDPEGSSAYQIGEELALNMLKAHEAFEKKDPGLDSLLNKVESLVTAHLGAITAFEEKWGVDGRN